MNQYKNLKVWQKSLDLVVEIYEQMSKLPDKEKISLISQINRSATSIVSNIAEGAGRNSDKEFNNFLGIALGSSCELETQLIIANRLHYLKGEKLDTLVNSINEIQKMITALKRNLKSTEKSIK
jgi:four helix bundle protein